MSESAALPWAREQWDRFAAQATQGRLAHAYLLTGERGLGKRLFAGSCASLLLCENSASGTPCQACRGCRLLGSGSNPDLLVVKPEEGSRVIKIEQIRALTSFASLTVHGTGHKVVILEQAHCLNVSAANALLKTLEEPPAGTVLLLVSDTAGRLSATIRSRCQRIVFTLPEREVAASWLGVATGENQGLEELLEMAGGRPLLAQALFESGGLEERVQILRAFEAVLAGRLDPQDLAHKGRETGAGLVLEYLWHTTSAALKALLRPEESTRHGKEIQAIVVRLKSSSRSEDDTLARLLSINQAADEARRQVQGVSNPNAQLVLESVMWRWSRLAG